MFLLVLVITSRLCIFCKRQRSLLCIYPSCNTSHCPVSCSMNLRLRYTIFLWVCKSLLQYLALAPVVVGVPTALQNSTKVKKKKVPIDINSITVDSFQCSKRKLILEIGKGGLGNKLWGVRLTYFVLSLFLFQRFSSR